MKKFYYFFVLLFGLTVMTSCEKDEPETPKTDQERFVGTWVYQNPSASSVDDVKECTFTFNADGKGNEVWIDGGNRRDSYRILEWSLFEDKGDKYLKYMDEDGDEWEYEYKFDGDILLLDIEGYGLMWTFNRK